MERVVDVITEILAVLTVALIVLLYVNRYVGSLQSTAGFMPANVTNILESVREIAVLIVVGLAGLQFALKHGIIIFILYAVLVAAAVIFMFFPGVLPVAQAKDAVTAALVL